MKNITKWLKDHASAILATALVVGKSGALGTGASGLLIAMAGAFGASI